MCLPHGRRNSCPNSRIHLFATTTQERIPSRVRSARLPTYVPWTVWSKFEHVWRVRANASWVMATWDRRDWKHYLCATWLAGGNDKNNIVQTIQGEMHHPQQSRVGWTTHINPGWDEPFIYVSLFHPWLLCGGSSHPGFLYMVCWTAWIIIYKDGHLYKNVKCTSGVLSLNLGYLTDINARDVNGTL